MLPPTSSIHSDSLITRALIRTELKSHKFGDFLWDRSSGCHGLHALYRPQVDIPPLAPGFQLNVGAGVCECQRKSEPSANQYLSHLCERILEPPTPKVTANT